MRRRTAMLCAAPPLALLIGVAATHAYTAATPPAAAASSAPATAVAVRPVLLTGEVEALDSQTVFVPPSDSSPVVLRNFVAEGNQVKAGDLVLRIDTGGAANIDRLKTELEQARARGPRNRQPGRDRRRSRESAGAGTGRAGKGQDRRGLAQAADRRAEL
jgi:multidrug efflux pump subunit AcrA (membrane-fusion protein)